ncbi:globin-coupled sensor protein [Jiella marina]|uniref:globin-coupled sensor protein n=1 Tax=Jiella sp. LLJ827 TaxID=2917712 RepID=UPI0021010D8D|nr:globin-coupled sensor protein [Jiella sp. LLJ827]MCQ0990472.1 methyl-accepting chemotaxis protein [Jiella sp. LLJ827]
MTNLDTPQDSAKAAHMMESEQLTQLKRITPIVEKHIETALDEFYGVIRANPQMKAFFTNDEHMRGAQSKQKSHWASIARGELGEAHRERAHRIGAAHVRVGLEPNLFISGYGALLGTLARLVVKEMWPKSGLFTKSKPDEAAASLEALIRAAMIDVELSVCNYLNILTREAMEKSLNAEKARAEATRAQVMEEIGGGLSRLAEGDLSRGIDAEFPPEFQRLKDDFNRAIEAFGGIAGAARSSAEAVSSGAGEIAVASDDLARRTEQQAASLEETTAALQELSSSVGDASTRASHASSLVKSSMQEAQSVEAVVKNAVAAMDRIEQSSSKIGTITTVIDEIAFQTNLLALNAGVEAARAGEAGKGFAVVAQEVRALAQRSAEAAKEIDSLIQESSREIASGVELVTGTGTAIETIVSRAAEITTSVSEIAETANKQAGAISEISSAIGHMDQSTQQNAAMVEESAAVAASLKDAAAELLQAMVAIRTAGNGGDTHRHESDDDWDKPAAPRHAAQPRSKAA